MATIAVCVLAGFMIAASAVTSRGTDLRSNRNTDLIQLVEQRAQRNRVLQSSLTDLRADVDALSKAGTPALPQQQLEVAAALAGFTAVAGPAVSVTLTDAPLTVRPVGVDEDLLVVHQQDIQAMMNALWASGAEAMTLQGQRVSARTGVKCVGNTVVIQGVPYAPPYVIVAIGDQKRMTAGLAASDYVRIYKQYVDRYKLGYAQRVIDDVTLPGYTGTVELTSATVNR